MIPYASCMCFGAERNPAKRRRQWKLVTAQSGTSMAVGKDDDLCIRFRGSEESISSVLTPSVLTPSELSMLEAVEKVDRITLAYAEQDVRVGGVRRTRQPVITRLLDINLLDDTYAGVTKTLLSQCSSWSFNTFNLDVSTGGRSLSYLLVHLFQEYGFVHHFRLDIVKVWHCFNLMEAAYHRHNPYHNSVHAADVTQAMHCFLQENKFAANLTPLEAMSSVIAAVAHDLDHPGVTQAFLVATSNHLVTLYHNSSVLENHHWRTAISCLSESGIFSHLEKDVWLDIQRQIRSLILATDITRQKEFLAKFKNYLNSECLDMEDSQYRHFALQIALKCADLCNPCRPWAISQRWSYQVCQEFYRQGAYERQLKLPLTPTFDCSRTKVAKIQADFFQFVVSPLFETWDHFLKTPLSSKLLKNLHHNFTQWQQRMEITQENESDVKVGTIMAPQIKVDPCSDSLENISTENKINLLSSEQDVVVKQHRSKSDSGLTPRLIPPKVHMETYSTEELHPSTTLLSLSSITNTVQLRQVYAATKVESHLICPTVFQPINSSIQSRESSKDGNSSLPPLDCSDVEICTISVSEIDESTQTAQSSVILTCPDGCGTPSPPEKPTLLEVNQAKQRSQSLINDSEVMKYYSQVLQNRRASDFGPYLNNKFSAAQKGTQVLSNNPSYSQIQHEGQLPFLCDEATIESISKSYSNEVSDSNTYANVCSNKLCTATSCICERAESYHITPSWCWHISRSFSEERPIRPSQDFDSPLPSWQGSSSSLAFNGRSGRRASAPVVVSHVIDICGSHLSSLGEIDSKSQKEESEGTAASGRRWSVPTETISGVLQLANVTSKIGKKECVPVHSTRRKSCGLLEPLTAMSSIEFDNSIHGTSTSKPTHTHCSAFDSEKVKEEINDRTDNKLFAYSDSILPLHSSIHQSSVQRRSSLPTEVPIAVMCHVSSPSHNHKSKITGEQFLFSNETPKTSNPSSFLLDHAHKHDSPSDLLSVLIGPPGMLNSMHGIVNSQTICKLPCMAQETLRRRSGGLEMLSGIWKSQTSDVIIGVSMASKLKLRSRLLEEWASWRTEEGNIKPSDSANSSISALGQQIMYQQRRGSVPLNISLLSLSSGK